ncbi:MAG: hypothetical protein AAGA96_12700 [Verrucomicrobiota bacterium]
MSFFVFTDAVSIKAEEWRSWNAADGRSLEAQLLKVTDDGVHVKRRADLKELTIPFDLLSEEDRAYAKELLEKQQLTAEQEEKEVRRSRGLKEGKYAELITDEFVRSRTDAGLPFQFWGSQDFDGDERYPLVLFLHGGGARGGDEDWSVGLGAKIWTDEEHREKHPCFVVAPRCPEPDNWRGHVGDQAAALVRDLADHLPIDRSRIYVTGLSLGGGGSFYAVANHQDLFAATILGANGGPVYELEKFKNVPIWQFHGELDADSPVEQAREMAAAMKAAEAPHYQYTELAQQPHVIGTLVYSDVEVREWLFAQRLRGE